MQSDTSSQPKTTTQDEQTAADQQDESSDSKTSNGHRDEGESSEEGHVDDAPQDLPVLEATIKMSSNTFSLPTIKVRIGATVTWVNEDSTAHTVTANDERGPSSPQLDPKDSYSFVFNDAGTFTYYCQLHSGMKAQIEVID